MKKLIAVLTKALLLALVIFTMANKAQAYDPAKLQVEISGLQKNKYYLCMSNVGCIRIDGGNETLPIDALDVRYIFVANVSNYQIYPQNLPESCHVTVNSNQKLVVKGNLAKAANDRIYIANLHCAVL